MEKTTTNESQVLIRKAVQRKTYTTFSKGLTTGFICIKRKTWVCSSSTDEHLSEVFHAALSSSFLLAQLCWRLVDTGFHGRSSKTLHTSQPVARRATMRATPWRRKILWSPSLVTTEMAVTTLAFDLLDWASNTVTVKMQQGLATGMHESKHGKIHARPLSGRHLFCICSKANPTVCRIHSCSRTRRSQANWQHGKTLEKACLTNTVASLLGCCCCCCCYGNKMCRCCGTILDSPQCCNRKLTVVCTQYTVYKQVALTFTRTSFWFCFKSYFSPRPRSVTAKAQHVWKGHSTKYIEA